MLKNMEQLEVRLMQVRLVSFLLACDFDTAVSADLVGAGST